MRSGQCIDCGQGFTTDAKSGVLPQRCQTCRALRKRATDQEKARRWREANPERSREHWNKSNRKRLADPVHRQWKREDAMFRAYGLRPADYDALHASQDGKCAICRGGPNGPGKRLHVDHCHDGGQVRGLLCGKCNTAIGLLDNDPARADALATYLRR